MSDSNQDLVVVSAFGRGHWLASEFASRGWQVTMLDVTSSLSSAITSHALIDERDVEGPFGLLEAADLLPSQRARLNDEGEFVSVPGGFTMWLPEGPLEFRSELTSFLMRARNIPGDVESYLRQPNFDAKEALGERRQIRRLQYVHSWLAQFAHSLTSAAHFENYLALDSDAVAPLFAPYGLRQATGAGFSRGLKNCQSAGVNVVADAVPISIHFDGKVLTSINFETSKRVATQLSSRAFVWCLSSHETNAISDSLLRALYPVAWPDAAWAWQRVSFTSSSSEFLSQLPLSSVLIDDIDLAWTRANMILLRRREGQSEFDAWVKIPTWMRRERNAYDQVRDEVRLKLEARFPGVNLEVADQEMTPILWPIWSGDEFDSMQRSAAPRKSPNTFFDSPGLWTSLDWMGRFRHQTGIATKLEKLKTQWDAAARKAEAASQRQRPTLKG